MKKHIAGAVALLSPGLALAGSFGARFGLGIVDSSYKFEGEDEAKRLKGAELNVGFQFGFGPFFIRPLAKVYLTSYKKKDWIDDVMVETTVNARPYLASAEAGFRFLDGKYGIEFFGAYGQGIGGKYEVEQKYTATLKSNKVSIDYKNYKEYGGGAYIIGVGANGTTLAGLGGAMMIGACELAIDEDSAAAKVTTKDLSIRFFLEKKLL